jgi:hypothetical protein
MLHTAIGVVDTYGPYFFAGLSQCQDNIGTVHPGRLFAEEVP